MSALVRIRRQERMSDTVWFALRSRDDREWIVDDLTSVPGSGDGPAALP